MYKNTNAYYFAVYFVVFASLLWANALCLLSLSAQNITTVEQELKRSDDLIESLIEQNKWEEAIKKRMEAARKFSSVLAPDSAIKLWSKVSNTALASGNHYLLNMTVDTIQKVLSEFERIKKNKEALRINYYLGCIYQDMDRLSSAIDHYERACTMLNKDKNKNKKDDDLLNKIYIRLGSVYGLIGETELGLSYEKKAVEHFHGSSDLKSLSKALLWKGTLERYQGKAEESLKSLQKCEALNQEDTYTGAQLHLAYLYLVEANDIELAEKHAQIYYEKTKHNKDARVSADALHLLGRVAEARKHYTKARYYFEQTYQIAEQSYGKSHSDCAKELYWIGHCFLNEGMPQKALSHFKQTLHSLQTDIQLEKTSQNVSKEVEFSPNFWVLNTHLEIARTYIALQKERLNQTAYTDTAINYYRRTAEYLAYMQQGYVEAESKLKINDQYASEVFPKGIEACVYQYKQNQHSKYLKQALELLEQSRAFVLRSKLQDKNAKITANIPAKVLQEERNILENIINFEKLRDRDSDNPAWKDSLFEAKKQKNEFVQSLQKNFPTYYRLKYQISTVNTDTIKKYLGADDAFVAYQFNGNLLYAFVVCHQYERAYELPLPDNFREQVSQFKSFFENSQTLSSNSDRAEYISFVQNGYQIYQTILDTLVQELPKNINHLCLVPDRILNYIPFTALLYAPVVPQGQDDMTYLLEKMPYLLKKYSFAHLPSIFWLREKDKINAIASQKEAGLLAIAPQFPKNGENDHEQGFLRQCQTTLKALHYNRQEAEYVVSLMGGKILAGIEGTIENFRKYAPNAHILHMSTHACTDETNEEGAFIYLSNGYLSLNEIYRMELNSSLAVLSACETGSGKILEGEGVMSLARAFMYAGCKSVITSLWSIDDQSTANLMKLFYQALNKENELPSKALRQAQLQFLKNQNNELSHPSYWAAFISIGQEQVISTRHSLSNIVLCITIALAGLGLAGWFFLKTSKRTH